MTHLPAAEQPYQEPTKIVFVCLGNICRSPMAEAVLRAELAARGLDRYFHVTSTGTGTWHIGKPPHPGTLAVLREKGISAEGLRAKHLEAPEINKYDYIIAMDRSNVDNLVRMGVPRERIRLLSEFIPGAEVTDVPDPYYDGNFEQVYELVQAGVQGLLQELVNRAAPGR